MTRKPTTKSPDERRLRKHIRELLQVYAADTSRLNTDATVREFLDVIDDEVRRTRMSIAPFINPYEDVARWRELEAKERVEIKKTIYAAALEGKLLTCGGKQ